MIGDPLLTTRRAGAIRARLVAPALLVALIALTSATPSPCASTDGPQYACWLDGQS